MGEAGSGPADPGVRALTGNGLQLPIGAASPVVRRYPTRLTDTPVRSADIVRGFTLGGSGAVNGGYFCRALPGDIDPLPGWSAGEIDAHHRAVEQRIGVRTQRRVEVHSPRRYVGDGPAFDRWEQMPVGPR